MAEYINRSALVDYLCKEFEIISCENADGTCDFAEGFNEAINAVRLFEYDTKNDVAPIVHAEWEIKLVSGKVKAVCSRCGMPNKKYTPPYCPHCGAKMEEDDE